MTISTMIAFVVGVVAGLLASRVQRWLHNRAERKRFEEGLQIMATNANKAKQEIQDRLFKGLM